MYVCSVVTHRLAAEKIVQVLKAAQNLPPLWWFYGAFRVHAA